MKKLWTFIALAALAVSVITLWACPPPAEHADHVPVEKLAAHLWLAKDSGSVKDEALKAERTAESFPPADEDYFKGMDQNAELTVDEVKGRNNWIVWTGGNDRFWDWLSQYTFGNFDLLKVLSSHPEITDFSRDNRWYWFGLVNEPGFEKWTPPEGCDDRTEGCGDPEKYGLWLDKRVLADPDPFANADKYPGVEIGARGRNVPVGSFYGEPSGIVGLRLFPNPYFDEEAEAKWDPIRYYTDEAYYTSPDLVRPYRVGMSCGFCHVGPSPVDPPDDFENPQWVNLNSNPGAQYFWFDRVFLWQADEANFIYQWYMTNLPGTLDTSLVSSDNINNPRTMNAVYSVPARLEAAKRWHKEVLSGGGLANKQFSDYPQFAGLGMYEPPDTVWTPMVLKDGADSVGVLGALNRVYVNIGLFSEEWVTNFLPAVGGKKITPFRIEVAQQNSTYWNATTDQTPFLAAFFLKTARPDYLKDAPGGEDHLSDDEAVLERGKIVFAENCARCHSSKQPPVLCEAGAECPEGGVFENSAEHYAWLAQEVVKPDFLDDNFLSTEKRIPVTELGTNICSPLATNAIQDDIWDNFSSQTYKDLPSVGTVTLHHPLDGTAFEYEMPAGGRGYTRVPSLISIWSTAPFLVNNSLGKFRWEGTVEARMDSFNDSIEKLLWPEKRRRDAVLGDKVPGYIQRTTQTSYLKIPPGALPGFLRDELEDLDLGPIPQGTPVGYLANLDITPSGELGDDLEQKKKLAKLVVKMIKDLKEVRGKTEDEAREIFKNLVPDLLAASKCPDFVVNKGHYFGSDLPDEDKRALIEFLKYM